MSDASTSPESTPAADTTVADDAAQIARQRDEYLAQLMRERAEFSNYQKRARTQADTDRLYAVTGVATDLLPVIDNFERATEAARASGATAIVEGLDMVHKQLLAALAKHGVEPISSLGQPFDPNLHNAIMQQPSADHPENTVVMEVGKGYKLRDRILRPSQVAVSIKPAG